jgi:hypothetical protein
MRWILVVAVLGCGKHASEPPPHALDRAQVYPMIVTERDLPTGPVRRPLVDGLVITLAQQDAQNGHAKVLRLEDLDSWPLDDAYATALANLDRAAHDIPLNAEVGSGGRTVDVVLGHDWRAAACLLLPGMRQLAEQKLGSEHIFAAIPNRDVLVLFADRGLAPTVLAAEHNAQHKITDRVLRVDGDHVGWSDQ